MKRRHLAGIASLVLLLGLPSAVLGSHSWGTYHWARESNPFTLKVGDNVNPTWDPYLDTTISDWSVSDVLDLLEVPGSAKGRNCRPPAGRVEVCNAAYGNNGWLGIAQIWVQGSHITQGSVRNNDTYFNTSTYNTPAWRNLVMCQEVGHTLGLDHQDEAFDNPNLGTCMDYTSSPSSNQHPNQGDYDQLLCIYDPASAGKTLTTSTHSCTGTGHLDSSTTVGSIVPTGTGAWHGELGREISRSAGAGASASVFVRDLGAGVRLISLVIWAS